LSSFQKRVEPAYRQTGAKNAETRDSDSYRDANL